MAFFCWGIGALLILIPVILIFVATPANTWPHIIIIFIGVVALATGGTLHQAGTGREEK